MHSFDTVALLHSCFLFSALSRALDHIPNAFALAQACHKTNLHLTLSLSLSFSVDLWYRDGHCTRFLSFLDSASGHIVVTNFLLCANSVLWSSVASLPSLCFPASALSLSLSRFLFLRVQNGTREITSRLTHFAVLGCLLLRCSDKSDAALFTVHQRGHKQ